MMDCLVPVRVSVLSKRSAISISCSSKVNRKVGSCRALYQCYHLMVSVQATTLCTERGTVYAWGYNQAGRLGLGEDAVEEKICSPMLMRYLDGAEIRQIETGDAHSVALTNYYCADAVPERADQGGSSLADEFVYQAYVARFRKRRPR